VRRIIDPSGLGFALPVEEVVIGRQDGFERVFDIAIFPNPGNELPDGGVDLHSNPCLNEVFEQGGERLVFDGEPKAILIEPEFMQVGVRKQSQPPEKKKKGFDGFNHDQTVASLCADSNRRKLHVVNTRFVFNFGSG